MYVSSTITYKNFFLSHVHSEQRSTRQKGLLHTAGSCIYPHVPTPYRSPQFCIGSCTEWQGARGLISTRQFSTLLIWYHHRYLYRLFTTSSTKLNSLAGCSILPIKWQVFIFTDTILICLVLTSLVHYN